jgi:hypothetical protein
MNCVEWLWFFLSKASKAQRVRYRSLCNQV